MSFRVEDGEVFDEEIEIEFAIVRRGRVLLVSACIAMDMI